MTTIYVVKCSDGNVRGDKAEGHVGAYLTPREADEDARNLDKGRDCVCDSTGHYVAEVEVP